MAETADLEAGTDLGAVLDGLLAEPVGLLSDEDVLAQLRGLEVLRRRVESAGHARILELERRGTAQTFAVPDTARLLSAALRITGRDARARVKDATELGCRVGISGQTAPPLYPQLAALHAAGQIGAEHVRVVTRLVDRLPEAVRDTDADTVEATLAPLAARFAPDALAVLARRVEALIHPDGLYTDPGEQERRRAVRLVGCPDGTGRLEGWLTGEALAVWQALFDALAAPRPADDLPDTRSAEQRGHDALLEAGQMLLRAGYHPNSGAAPATVQMIITAEQIQHAARQAQAKAASNATDRQQDERPASEARPAGQTAAHAPQESVWESAAATGSAATAAAGCSRWVTTGHGGVLTLEQACRLAAEADLLPVVLSTLGGAVLNLGRSSRLASKAQRRALAARDRGCTFPGCTAPPAWCEVHHVIAWLLNGATNIDNLALLCGYHHRVFDTRGWTIHMHDGIPWWTPPAWIDPDQTPRRNHATHLDRLAIEALRDAQRERRDALTGAGP